jgi:hypothetical protein
VRLADGAGNEARIDVERLVESNVDDRRASGRSKKAEQLVM